MNSNKPIYTTSGRLIEFPRKDANFFKYLTLKVISLMIDYLLIFIPLILLWMLYTKSILFISLIGLAWSIPYNAIMLASFDATAGMLITKLRVGHATGFLVPRWVVFIRALMNSTYAIPFMGWVIMLTNFVIAIIYRGWTLGDLFTRTTIFTKNTFDELNDIEEHVHKNIKI